MASVMMKKYLIFAFLLGIGITSAHAGKTTLDDFNSLAGWRTIASDEVRIDTSLASGYSGKCIRIDFNFVAGSGYCGITKNFTMTLPENYEFSFYIRGAAPVNNLEFKLVDSTGDNVWWLNQRNFDFPEGWKKIVIRKRHITFAWGPAKDRTLRRFQRIEFIISSATGGKGTVYLDHFQFRELAPPDSSPYVPKYTASSVLDPHHATGKIFDHDTSTGWHSRVAPEQQALLIDLQKPREYGGLIINWDSKDFAERYNVLISNDAATWDTAYSVIHGKGGKSYLYLKDQNSRFLKLELLKSHRGAGYGIREIEIKPPSFSENRNAFFTNIAKDYPRGYFPKYLYREQSYWTVVGVNGDNREALVNEEGMVEVDKTSFSIEPFIFNGNKLLTWNDTKNSQSLEKDYLPVPSIARVSNKIQLETKVFAAGETGSSVLYLIYSLKNTSSDQIGGDFF